MIQEAYCSFETAKLLKEKGFNEWCDFTYGISVRHNGKEIDEDEEFELKVAGRKSEIEYIEGGHLYRMTSNNTDFPNAFAAPTQQMAMRWLREVHNIHINVEPDWISKGGFKVIGYMFNVHSNSNPWYEDSNEYPTYEEAVESAILYCLENLI